MNALYANGRGNKEREATDEPKVRKRGGRKMIDGILFALAVISGACFIAAYELDYRQQRAEVLRIKKKAARAYDRGYENGWRDSRW